MRIPQLLAWSGSLARWKQPATRQVIGGCERHQNQEPDDAADNNHPDQRLAIQGMHQESQNQKRLHARNHYCNHDVHAA